MGKIYLDNGYLNIEYLYSECKFIMAITGPRGSGKTYGFLKYVAENKIRFIYMRRLKSQLDNCVKSEELNPFKAVNTKEGTSIIPRRKSGSVQFVDNSDEEDPVIVGYGVALSTVATIRGGDYSDVDCVIFDEYIAMSGERPIADEAAAFMGFLETVNRNRELEGRSPVKVFMLGNANKLMNPYFLHWHFMKTALKMLRGKQMVWRNQDNTRIMILLQDSPIAEKKRETAIYRNTSGDYLNMALDNAFKTDSTGQNSRKLKDCRHMVSIGEIGIYVLKSTGEIYVSETVNKTQYLAENEINLSIFQARYGVLRLNYLYGRILFENYETELLFRAYIGL